MRIPVLALGALVAAVAAGAQCPVSGDAGACTTPDDKATAAQSATKPASAKAKPSQKSGQPAAGRASVASAPPATEPSTKPTNAPPEDSITKVQADAILIELKEIRALLQKQQPAVPPVDFSKFNFESFPVVKLASDGRWDNALGKDDAPVTMVEFSDYQCGHCAKFHSETFESIKKKYIESGRVRFVSRDYPLPFHPWAMAAAEASRCAGDQGKYFEMRDGLMRRSNEISPAIIEQVARAIPLDMGLYHACTESRKYYSAIRDDQQAALAAQIPATPGFVIGKTVQGATEGKRLMGARPVEDFERLIDEALATKQ
jgi:protein-disulfide isomerase